MAKSQMVINYVPGEECRVAVVYDGKLHELHAERMDNVSHVGNIYVGKVVNVEAAIQAAFVDFGLEHNGFLHVSDLHPQYFPDARGDTTERVGKKTPRRDRPPIQECLRRGDEVAVQVLKEGVGTKGPTVTSYLSIPGRFLVMMPQMDRVGVSRKVEDEDTRRKMREILDQLDLPEGFGFILRTAGMDRGKMELKRDLAYLQRLWKDMEKRWKGGNKPRLLYSESDLLVRALRDILSSDIEEVVVDNEAALTRAGRFLKIVAPRATTKLIHYTGHAPIFHVMGLEEQIQMIHAREVPLPSGGRLVIDETEALVAIDVNSGKSRDARDAETNAFRTNMEATEEICRQLRLRDLGGVVINDLIDMRFAKHRREVENLWKELLKKDRARWTIAPISEFGILEMTRQRMRGSHESQHFGDCPTCRGRGLVQRPDSVAADSLRELSSILDNDRVLRVEMVVHPRIAGELLSTKRRALSRIERTAGKHVDVRVSDAIPVDRVTFYAYDDRGADLDVTKLGARRARPDEMVEYELPRAAAADDWASETEQPESEAVEEPQEQVVEPELHPIEIDEEPTNEPWSSAPTIRADGESEGGRRRRRRGRRGRGRDSGDQPTRDQGQRPAPAEPAAEAPPFVEGGEQQPTGDLASRHIGPDQAPTGDQPGEGGRRRRRRRRGRRGRGRGPDGAPIGPEGAPQGDFAPGDQELLEAGAPEPSGVEQVEVARDQAVPEQFAGESQGEQPMQPGPMGQPGGQPGEMGEGGRRRRRRRRRRGRGGQGQFAGDPGAMNNNGTHAPSPEQGAWSEGGGSDEQPAQSFEDNVESGEDDGRDGPSRPVMDEGGAGESVPDQLSSDRPPQGGGGERGEGSGRRRRRGRGRGGRGRGGEGGGAGGGNRNPNQQADRGGHHPPRHQQPQPPAQQSPPSSPATSSQQSGGNRPKPRVLYSSRRKLGPGEKRGLGGGDE